MSEKNFLNQFDSKEKPDSFKEEKRIPVKKSYTGLLIGVLSVLLLSLLGVALYFFLNRANIEMPNFVGQQQSEVSSWVRQYDIDSTGIVMKSQYSLDFDEGVVISQNIEAGELVKKDVKLNLLVSQGADPDELIALPDIKNMTKSELESWIKENKLSKTKIVTSYSDTVAEGQVISYKLNVDADKFVRSSTLEISVSKGKEVVQTKEVALNDFIDGSLEEFKAWADTNKITIEAGYEWYCNGIMAGNVCGIEDASGKSLSKGDKVKTGDKLYYHLSLGDSIRVPDFTSMSKNSYESWKAANASPFEASIYYNSDAYIISQSPSSGTLLGVDESNEIEVTINLGSSFKLEDVGISFPEVIFKDAQVLAKEAKNLGLNISLKQINEIYSTEYKRGQVITATCTSGGTNYACKSYLPLNVDVEAVVSKGKVYNINEGDYPTVNDLMNFLSEADITYKLDSKITALKYSAEAKLVLENGKAVEVNKNGELVIYEDKIYKIVLR